MMKKPAVLAAGLVLMAACGTPTAIYVRGVKPMNENEQKESRPVAIRIYLLKDDAKFNSATVEQLWTNAKEGLADDLVSMKQENVYPGAPDDREAKIDLPEMPESVRFIGVLALFSKEDEKGPRKIAIPKGEAGTVLRLTGYHIGKEK